MNDPTPLTPETVDALLSAELDGDLEAAARDLGLSASEARARLRATPGVDARRAALTRARDLIASRPPVDASVEAALVASALPHDDLAVARARRGLRERKWRVLVAVGSVAAAIAVIVGLASLSSPSSSDSKASAPLTSGRSAADATKPEAAKSADGAGVHARENLGDVTNANQLLLPSRKLLEKSATTPAGAKSSTTASAAPGPVNSQTYDSAVDRSAAAAAAPACTTARLRDYAVPDRPALIATGTVAGAPVVILIYDGTGTPSAYVIRVSDCALVKKLPLG